MDKCDTISFSTETYPLQNTKNSTEKKNAKCNKQNWNPLLIIFRTFNGGDHIFCHRALYTVNILYRPKDSDLSEVLHIPKLIMCFGESTITSNVAILAGVFESVIVFHSQLFSPKSVLLT